MTLSLALSAVQAARLPAARLQSWLHDGGEIALLDVREHGQYGEGHPFFAVNAPYSRLEAVIGELVPRLDVRTVLLDDGDGVAERAARRLQSMGYGNLHLLAGGAPAWAAAGHVLFKGVNLPSKTFGELVEHHLHTPHISAAELHRRQRAGEPLVLIDGRTLEEHRRMTIPGAIPIPNGELALRIASVLRDARTPVVVHCAGRTRSIIGAQTLIELGLPNPVHALENGTQGWCLAGFELEHGSARAIPEVSRGRHAAPVLQGAALALAARHRVPRLSTAQAQAWLDDPGRTTYVFDVRTRQEYEAGSQRGARHVPGGQLIQATDLAVGVRRSRILLLDDDGAEGVRARVVGAWLRRLGFEAATVEQGVAADLRITPPRVWPAPIPLERLTGQRLRAQLDAGAVRLLDVRASADHRKSHPVGAVWSIRPRLAQAIGAARQRLVLLADDARIAQLAALDLEETGVPRPAWCNWQDCLQAGLPVTQAGAAPADDEAIDYLFFVHDRHDGNLAAARQYLEWETGLIAQCTREDLAQFRLD